MAKIWLEVFEIKLEVQFLDEEPFSKQKLSNKNATPVSAAMINQQINSYAEQISDQQLTEFIATLEQALNAHAHSTINTEQLLKVMLSFASS